MKEILFSVNEYDKDGDLINKSILLDFNKFIIRLDDLEDLEDLINQLVDIKKEIQENFTI
jgi:hypothetical protein